MSDQKRWTTPTAVVLICALALVFGVMPSTALVGNHGMDPEADGAAIESKFPEPVATTYPRIRTTAEMALIEMSYPAPSVPSPVVASEEDDAPAVDLQYTVEELEQFRADVIEYARDYEALVDALAQTRWATENPEYVQLAAVDVKVTSDEFYDNVALMSHEDLAVAKTVFDADPEWKERPAQFVEMISWYEGLYAQSSEEGMTTALGVEAQWSTWSPPADYDGAIFAARYVAINSAVAMEVLPPDITIIIFGAGASIPNPLRIIAVGAWAVAENLVIYNEQQQDNRDDYNMEYLIDHAHLTGDRVRDNLDMAVSSVDSRLANHDVTMNTRFNAVDLSLGGLETHLLAQDTQITALETHLGLQDVDRTARLDAVDAELTTIRAQLDAQDVFLDEMRTLMMRTSIEDNMLSDGMPLAAFMLPASEGGWLDDAHDVVVQTIADMRGAGLSVNNADTELRRGDAAYAVGDYKEAYARYRSAYQEAVR